MRQGLLVLLLLATPATFAQEALVPGATLRAQVDPATGSVRVPLATPPGWLRLRVSGQGFDVRVEVRDAAGALLASDDDSGPGSDALAAWEADGRAAVADVASSDPARGGPVELLLLAGPDARPVRERAVEERDGCRAQLATLGPDDDLQRQTRLQLELGEAWLTIGSPADAAQAFESALALTERVALPDAGLERARGGLGLALSRQLEFVASEPHLQAARDLALARGDGAAAADWSGYLGGCFLYRRPDDADDARALLVAAAGHFEAAFEGARAGGARAAAARWGLQLARARRLAGDAAGAIEALDCALPFVDGDIERGRAHASAGTLLVAMAHYRDAEDHLRTALELGREDDPRQRALVLSTLGGLLAWLGESEEAARLLGQARDLAEGLTPPPAAESDARPSDDGPEER